MLKTKPIGLAKFKVLKVEKNINDFDVIEEGKADAACQYEPIFNSNIELGIKYTTGGLIGVGVVVGAEDNLETARVGEHLFVFRSDDIAPQQDAIALHEADGGLRVLLIHLQLPESDCTHRHRNSNGGVFGFFHQCGEGGAEWDQQGETHWAGIDAGDFIGVLVRVSVRAGCFTFSRCEDWTLIWQTSGRGSS